MKEFSKLARPWKSFSRDIFKTLWKPAKLRWYDTIFKIFEYVFQEPLGINEPPHLVCFKIFLSLMQYLPNAFTLSQIFPWDNFYVPMWQSKFLLNSVSLSTGVSFMLVGLSEVCHSIHSGLLEPVPLGLSYSPLCLLSALSVPHISVFLVEQRTCSSPSPTPHTVLTMNTGLENIFTAQTYFLGRGVLSCHSACVCRSEDNLWEKVHSFYHVDLWCSHTDHQAWCQESLLPEHKHPYTEPSHFLVRGFLILVWFFLTL